MKKLAWYLLTTSFLSVVLLIGGYSSPARANDASSQSFAFICKSGAVQAKDTDTPPKPLSAGYATIVNCSDGSDLTLDTTFPTTVPLSVLVHCTAEVGDPHQLNGKTYGIQCHDPSTKTQSSMIDPNQAVVVPGTTPTAGPAFTGDCGNGGVKVSITPDTGGNPCVGDNTANGNPIYVYLRGIIFYAGSIFGILMVLMIIVGGIQYTTSGGNPQGVQNAKKRIGNAVLGIILFLFMIAILNYLIPGGVL